MEAFIAGAAAALIGVLSGQGLIVSTRNKRISRRITAIEEVIPELITRGEVQNAFAEMAKIEGARVAQQQQQQQQQSRIPRSPQQVPPFAQSPTIQQAAGLNQNINVQLDALTERINKLNEQMGV